MIIIKEPFFPLNNAESLTIIPNAQGINVVILNGVEIPLFRISRLVGCYWSHYRDYNNPLEISDALNEIFNEGNEVHFEDETLTRGSSNIIDSEPTMIIIHKSKKFGLSGHNDYFKFNFHCKYIEDLKSCQKNAFYYFVKCIEEGLSRDYRFQLGGYAYLKYVYHGIWADKGVITRIQKDQPLNRMSICDDIPTLLEMRSFILKHPVLLTVMGVIDKEKLIDVCTAQMQSQAWKCGNCNYNSQKECPVRGGI